MRIGAQHLAECLIDKVPASMALNEASRMEVLQQKYPSIDPKVIKAIAMADPSSVIKGEGPAAELGKAGGYTDWMIRWYKKKYDAWIRSALRDDSVEEIRKQANEIFNTRFLDEDLPGWASDLQVFHRHKSKIEEPVLRDINKLAPDKLREVATKLRRKTDELKTGNVQVLYKDDKLILVVPLDLAASITWGQATDWCTARPENTMFARYTRDGPLFIIWYDYGDLSDPNKGVKYQFHFESDQFMKYDDTPVRNLTTFCKELPIELREKMYEYHSKAPTSHNDATRNFMERILFPEKLVAKIVQSSGAKCPPDTDLRVLCAEKEITPQTFNAAIQSMHGHGYNCYHMDEDESLWLKLADLEYADGLFKSSNYARLLLQGDCRTESLPSEVPLDDLVQMADRKTNDMADELFPNGWITNSTVRMQFARIYVDTEDNYYATAAQEAAIEMIRQDVCVEDGQVRHTSNGTEFLLTSDRYTLPRYLETYEGLLVCTLGEFKCAFDEGHGKIYAPESGEIDYELRKRRTDMRNDFNAEAQKYLAELASENKEMEARPDFVPNRPTPDSAHHETGSEERRQPPTSDAIPDPAVEQIPLEEPDKTDQT